MYRRHSTRECEIRIKSAAPSATNTESGKTEKRNSTPIIGVGKGFVKMKIEKPAFPLTLDAFISYQEAAAGREIRKNECEVCEAWVPMFNASYVEGQRNDEEGLIASMDMMDELIARHEGSKVLLHLLKGLRWWIAYAWKQGREEATE